MSVGDADVDADDKSAPGVNFPGFPASSLKLRALLRSPVFSLSFVELDGGGRQGEPDVSFQVGQRKLHVALNRSPVMASLGHFPDGGHFLSAKRPA
jgi:hypothetical protein